MMMDIQEKKKLILQKTSYTVEDLCTVVEILRAPGGCPWDREQTHGSIRNDLIEETYEVIEAIDNEDPALLREELGDVLLQVAMHAEMEREAGRCNMDDIADGICKKMIHRHPHVFGDVQAETSAEVLANWEVIKSEEKQRETVTSKLRSVPRQLPALMRAEKVGKKAKCFDFPDAESVFSKLDEEKSELYEAYKNGDSNAVEEELGDLLLTVTSLARKLGVKSENALNGATDKFINRFEAVENEVVAENLDINELSMAELDAIWDKNKEKMH